MVEGELKKYFEVNYLLTGGLSLSVSKCGMTG